MKTIKVYNNTADFLLRYAKVNELDDAECPVVDAAEAIDDIIRRFVLHVMDDDEKEACGVRF